MNLSRFLSVFGLGLGVTLGGGFVYLLATDEVARGVTFGIVMFLGGALVVTIIAVIFLVVQAKTSRLVPPQISNHYRLGGLPAQGLAGGGAYYEASPPVSPYDPPQLLAGAQRVFTNNGGDNGYGGYHFPPVSEESHSGVDAI